MFTERQLGVGDTRYLLAQVTPFDFNWRCDVYGNILAVLFNVLDVARARIAFRFMWGVGINDPWPVKNLYPVVHSGDPDWRPYYTVNLLNLPHHYHNGGIWPFIGGQWVRFIQRLGYREIAYQELVKLAKLNQDGIYEEWEFNEWAHGETGRPMGKAYQAWSASSFLRACHDLRVGSRASSLAGVSGRCGSDRRLGTSGSDSRGWIAPGLWFRSALGWGGRAVRAFCTRESWGRRGAIRRGWIVSDAGRRAFCTRESWGRRGVSARSDRRRVRVSSRLGWGGRAVRASVPGLWHRGLGGSSSGRARFLYRGSWGRRGAIRAVGSLPGCGFAPALGWGGRTSRSPRAKPGSPEDALVVVVGTRLE